MKLSNVLRKIPVHLQYVKPYITEEAKSPATQWAEMIKVFLRYRLTPKDYRFYGFYKKGTTLSSARSVLSTWWHHKYLLPVLNDPRWIDILENKLTFDAWFRGHIRLPEVYGFAHPVFGYTSHGRFLRTKSDLIRLIQSYQLTEFVAKPIGGSQGRRVTVVVDIEYRSGLPVTLHCQDGSMLTIDEFSNSLFATDVIGGLSGYIVQQRLIQHPDLAVINPYTLNTLRLITFRGDDEPEIHMGFLKLGRKGQRVDNLGTGGVSVGVDLCSGILKPGVYTEGKDCGRPMIKHPDTGVEFVGRKLPYWERVLDQVKSAANRIPFVRTVGWDVVITPDGPVILEGNTEWGLHTAQIHCENGYITETVREKLSIYGVRFPR